MEGEEESWFMTLFLLQGKKINKIAKKMPRRKNLERILEGKHGGEEDNDLRGGGCFFFFN